VRQVEQKNLVTQNGIFLTDVFFLPFFFGAGDETQLHTCWASTLSLTAPLIDIA
jgi:hypothetical protein